MPAPTPTMIDADTAGLPSSRHPTTGAKNGIPAARDSDLIRLADQCVMCGLCLPHCPTYRLEAIEAESPRGRIALARALASGTLEPGSHTLAHLDQCLGCLSCQKVCPSQVQYEDILVRTRALLNPLRARPAPLRRWLRDPHRLTLLARLGTRLHARRWLPALGRLLPRHSLLRRMAGTLPGAPHITLPRAASGVAARTRGRVALFRGCVASVYDRDTLSSARLLLEALGYSVIETSASECCGALPQHSGDVRAADRLAAGTRAVLEDSRVEVVLSCASGCYGNLRDQVLAGSRVRPMDIHAFLAADSAFGDLRFRPLSARAALHQPCTQINTVGDTASIDAVLARIPALEVLTLPLQPRCCGAAGSYFIEQPERADRLRDEKLDQAAPLSPDFLLTTNIGCRIHLANGVDTRGQRLPVIHPLTLLAQQLEPSAS